MDQANQNPDAVEAAGGNDKADAICEATLVWRKFGSMGVTVKDRECPYDQGRNQKIWFRFERDHDAKDERRKGNPNLNARQRNTGKAEKTTEGHDDGKGDRQQP